MGLEMGLGLVLGLGMGLGLGIELGMGLGIGNYKAKITFFQKFQTLNLRYDKMGHFKPDLLLKFFWFDPLFKS